MLNLKQIEFCLDKIGDMFPHAECELVHSNPFELVVAVALSAQCTDALVNRVTKTLFQKYKRVGRLFGCSAGRASAGY